MDRPRVRTSNDDVKSEKSLRQPGNAKPGNIVAYGYLMHMKQMRSDAILLG